MKFHAPSLLLLAFPPGLPAAAANPADGRGRRLQATSCLASSPFTTASFVTTTACTPDLIKDAVSDLMAQAGCDADSLPSELAALLDVDEDRIDAALRAACAGAFDDATLDFRKITRRGDAFDREFFHGGSDWNDQYELATYDGATHHVLKEDASRILFEHDASQGKRPMGFPSHLPSFDNCEMGAAMCCYTSDRQSDDAGGTCDGPGGCADAEPEGNADVCVASMADAPVAARVNAGLAVFHLNETVEPAEGPVNCHGLAWDSTDGFGSPDGRYKGNLLFDVAFKQSLYDKGYVKNVPGAPMCGCIEQMPTVTRADCTKILSVSETYTLSITDNGMILEMTDTDVQYGPCGAGEDLASHYKEVNAANDPEAIDAKLVGEGNCLGSIDDVMQTYGYKRSVLEVREAHFTPPDVSPARVTVKFNTEVRPQEAAYDAGDKFRVYDAADPTTGLAVSSYAMKLGNTAVELTLASPPVPGASYKVSNLVRLHKRVAPMVVLEADGAGYDIAEAGWDYLQIGPNWRLARVCEGCSRSHFSVSSPEDDEGALATAQIFRDTGTTHPGPRSDYNGWDDVDAGSGPTHSADGIRFGDKAVQVRDWRIRQIDGTHLSVTHANGNVARIYRADGTVHGNVDDFSGYRKPLGEPACAYLATSYLQLGDWRFGAFDATHLSVSHRLGKTAMIYRTDGTVHPGNGRRDYNAWTLPDEEAVLGTSEGCDPLDPPEPNVLSIGDNWRLAQMYNVDHLSVSSRQPDGTSGNAAQTAMIFQSTGTTHPGPRRDYNGWGEVPTYSDEPPRFGDRTLEIDAWRIRQIDAKHLSVTHQNGNVARIYHKDGTIHGRVNAFSGYIVPALGEPTCAFLTERFLQLGDFRLGEINDQHLGVGHRDGKTSMIYKRDGTTHPGPRTDFNPWNMAIDDIVQGSADGCVSILSTTLVAFGSDTPKVLVEFNVDLPETVDGMEGLFKIYDSADAASELGIAGAALKDDSTLELVLASEPSSEVSYQLIAVDAVPTRDPIETLPAGTVADVSAASWDYLTIGSWRLARVCESCSRSHFSVSSDSTFTSQIFRETGTLHPGPRKDYNGWDRATYSASGVRFGNFAVQVRDWRIKQIDQTHLSVTHESGEVARIYRADGTVHGKVNGFSGYKTALGEPTCAYLTDAYLQVGDWRFGEFVQPNGSHLSVAHRLGKTAMIYRDDGTLHQGPRTDFKAWALPKGKVLMGSDGGCESSPIFG